MELVNKKNTLLVLAAILVVALGYMALQLSARLKYKAPAVPAYEQQMRQIETQSDSDEVDAIEADLESTQTDSLDVELQNIEAELEGNL